MAFNRAHLDMVLHRVESDFIRGTTTATPEKTRRYHMKISCVELRHGRCDPKVADVVQIDEQWYTDASVIERKLVERFMNREV